MKNQLLFAALVLSVALTSTSCLTSGVLVSTNATQVQLSQPNYKIVAANISGQASAGYLFGASFGVGMYSQTFALIPLQKDRALYRRSVEELWKNFEAKYGKVEGRSLALTNIRYDTQALNLFFYTKPRLTVIADVVEFSK